MDAIRHHKGPAMVIAGPGSGKTFVIVQRLKYLIEELREEPSRILVITFTKAAAMEMQHRFLKLTDSSYPEVNFGTFHSVFYQIIRQSKSRRNNNISIADDQFKFRFEGSWDTNIGLDAKDPTAVALGNEYPGKGGGANIKVPEDGVYDLFVIRDSLKTEAEATPEDYIFKVIKHYDNPYKTWTASDVWSVIGSINSTGNNWNQDEPMISDGTWWVCRNLELKSTDEFKFRKDHNWDVNIGLDQKEKGTTGLAVLVTGKGGGANIMVAEDGKYDLLVKPAAAEGEDDIFEICVAGTVPVFE